MTDTDIYRETLLDIIKSPSNKGSLTDATVEATENNPMCGDIMKMQIKIANDKIAEIAFDGDACAVGVAAASLLTEELKGKSVVEAAKFTKQQLLGLIGIQLTTSRVKCATLALDVLASALKKYEKSQS